MNQNSKQTKNWTQRRGEEKQKTQTFNRMHRVPYFCVYKFFDLFNYIDIESSLTIESSFFRCISAISRHIQCFVILYIIQVLPSIIFWRSFAKSKYFRDAIHWSEVSVSTLGPSIAIVFVISWFYFSFALLFIFRFFVVGWNEGNDLNNERLYVINKLLR